MVNLLKRGQTWSFEDRPDRLIAFDQTDVEVRKRRHSQIDGHENFAFDSVVSNYTSVPDLETNLTFDDEHTFVGVCRSKEKFGITQP